MILNFNFYEINKVLVDNFITLDISFYMYKYDIVCAYNYVDIFAERFS